MSKTLDPQAAVRPSPSLAKLPSAKAAAGNPPTKPATSFRQASAAGADSDLDRRRGPGRRRTDYRRDAEEGHMNEEQLEFIRAIDEYKRANSKPFPTWTEILDLMLYLGYRKVAPIGEFSLVKGRQGAGQVEDDDEV